MKPIHLEMSGFLSYRDKVELDFEQLHVACITGHNGAGKSSILDSMTYALFGEARNTGESLINAQSERAEIAFTFEFEGQRYRIIRRISRKKPTELIFSMITGGGEFITISESNRNRTEELIRQKLGFDYDTFINASFFQQGAADTFTKKKPAERKEILGKILGLGKWELYKDRAASKRKEVEGQVRAKNGLMNELNSRIAQEANELAKKQSAEADVLSKTAEKNSLEAERAAIQEKMRVLTEHREREKKQKEAIDNLDKEILVHETSIISSSRQLNEIEQTLAKADEIEAAYALLDQKRQELKLMLPVQQKYSHYQQQITQLEGEIVSEQRALEAKVNALKARQNEIAQKEKELKDRERELIVATEALAQFGDLTGEDKQLNDKEVSLYALSDPLNNLRVLKDKISSHKANLESDLRQLATEEERITTDKAELEKANKTLAETIQRGVELSARLIKIKGAKAEAESIRLKIANIEAEQSQCDHKQAEAKDRIAHLKGHEDDASCYLCEQALSHQDVDKLVGKLNTEITGLANRSANLATDKASLNQKLEDLSKVISDENVLLAESGKVAQSEAALAQTVRTLQGRIADWGAKGSIQKQDLEISLQQKTYFEQFRNEIDGLKAEIEPHFSKLGIPLKDLAQVEADYQTASKKISDDRRSLADRTANAQGFSRAISSARSTIEAIGRDVQQWVETGQKDLAESQKRLSDQLYAQEQQIKLHEVRKQLEGLGFDQSKFDLLQQAEHDSGSITNQRDELNKAKAEQPLVKQNLQTITDAKNNILVRKTEKQAELAATQALIQEGSRENLDTAGLDSRISQVADLIQAANRAIGAAETQLNTIQTAKHQLAQLEEEIGHINTSINHYRGLEAAFGKGGVPALLIEQAAPLIEAKANEYLEKLSDESMSVTINTQRPYADGRDNLKETLDIIISDGQGARDYEMYSGGEAFRVNFAIRLALSEVLAQRANARIQTLVIDEGFGSQDADGREKLKSCIKAIEKDFEKILIITHLEDLKEAFPNRIEVEKVNGTSAITVF